MLRWHVKGTIGTLSMLPADHIATAQGLARDYRETHRRAYHLSH